MSQIVLHVSRWPLRHFGFVHATLMNEVRRMRRVGKTRGKDDREGTLSRSGNEDV